MKRYRSYALLLCLVVVGAAAWLGNRILGEKEQPPGWTEVSPGVLRSPGATVGYALVSGDKTLLIDAPRPPDELKGRGIKSVEMVLLTHHHRDSCAFAAKYLDGGAKVRAARESEQWLAPEGVKKYWIESLPLRNSRTAYLVVPEGIDKLDCSLADGDEIKWHDWTLRVVASPGHSRDHVCFTARKGDNGPLLLFAGDALASAGKLWTPYTTDWDHWTDLGLKPAGESLRKLAALKPATILPAHGPAIDKDPAGALTRTAAAVEEMAFLKSFERFTKQRLKDAPEYRFLVKEQAESNGSKPWSRVSDHLYLTGNTYVLVSKDNACLVFDPWDPHSAKQLPKLKEDRRLGKTEVVLFSHAHYDHYDGVYSLLDREKAEVWALDHVAGPLAEPYRLRAPFLDVRPVKFDRLFKDGETATWREYRLKFRYLPGQTDFTMGVETEIDGKRCFFTADNFFHQDQFSGTGGWMGLNRSSPLLYAASAQKVLDAKPEWVLAEHGGAFEFNAEDFRRRVEWGKVGAKAADALCVTGDHRHDWDPHRVRIEPILRKSKAGEQLEFTLHAVNPLDRARELAVILDGRGKTRDVAFNGKLEAGGTFQKKFTLGLDPRTPPGRHVFVVRDTGQSDMGGADAFVVVEVEK